MKPIVICCLLASITLCGCNKDDGFSTGAEKPVAVTSETKIKIAVNGDVYVDNKKLSQEEFFKELQRIKQSNGGIVYTREKPHDEATAAQTAIVQVLQQSQVPLKYSAQ